MTEQYHLGDASIFSVTTDRNRSCMKSTRGTDGISSIFACSEYIRNLLPLVERMYSSTRRMDGHHTLSQIPRVCFDRCESHAGLRLPTVMLRPAAASSATTARRTVQPRCGFSLRHHLLCCPKRLPMPPAATTCLLTKAPPHKAAAAPRMSPSQTGRTSSPHGHAAHNHREEVFSAYDWRSALHHDDHDWTSTLTLARQIEHHRGRSGCRRKGKSRIFNSTTMQLICSRA
jgi:hypothetical protein